MDTKIGVPRLVRQSSAPVNASAQAQASKKGTHTRYASEPKYVGRSASSSIGKTALVDVVSVMMIKNWQKKAHASAALQTLTKRREFAKKKHLIVNTVTPLSQAVNAIGTPEILSAETPTSDTHITPRDDVKRPRSESKHGFLHGAAVLRKARTMFLKNKKRVISGMHDLFSMTCCIMLGIRTSVLQSTVPDDYRVQPQDYGQILKIFFKTKLKRKRRKRRKNRQYYLLKELKTDYEFKDYGGRLFSHIRRKFGIKTHDYLHSLGGRLPYLDFVSNSKSGEFFFFTYDRRYMIKTQPPGESVFLRSFLERYHNHLIRYPKTYLIKILGMHRVILNGNKQHFIVMENVFETHGLQLSKRFDLKGSTVGRRATNTEKRQLCPIMKDLDFMKTSGLKLGPRREAFLKQIEHDADFLHDLNIMDYSLLVGIYNIQEHSTVKGKGRRNSTYGLRDEQVSIRAIDCVKDKQMLQFAADFGKAETLDIAEKEEKKPSLKSDSKEKASTTEVVSIAQKTEQKTKTMNGTVDAKEQSKHQMNNDRNDKKDAKDSAPKEAKKPESASKKVDNVVISKKVNEKTVNDSKSKVNVKAQSSLQFGHGIRSWSEKNKSATGDEVYYMGIIDILTRYNTKKKLEHFFKGFTNNRNQISCVSSRDYAKRFLKFLVDNSKNTAEHLRCVINGDGANDALRSLSS